MSGDTLSAEELLLVEKMLDRRIPDIDSAMEEAYMETDKRLPHVQRRLMARNKVLAEVLGVGIPLVNWESIAVSNVANDPKEGPFDVKPRVFTLGEEEQ